jgi:hypothetical protein
MQLFDQLSRLRCGRLRFVRSSVGVLSMSVRLAGVVAAALVSLASQVALADEADTKRAIGRLIQVGWSTSAQARTAADAAFAEESPVIAGDLRALEAWTLILIQQRRYEDASKRVDQWLSKDADNLLALRARVWLSVILKNYPAAMLSAEKLADKLSPSEELSPGKEDPSEELVTFLGRIYGFLGGPGAGSANQEDRKSSEKRIVAILGDRREALFADARDGVLQQHLELADTKTEQRDKARDAEAVERDKSLAEIATERERMAKRANEIKGERDRLQSEMRSELDQLQKQDRPLAMQYTRLDAQAAGVNRPTTPCRLKRRKRRFWRRFDREECGIRNWECGMKRAGKRLRSAIFRIPHSQVRIEKTPGAPSVGFSPIGGLA